MTTQQAFTKMVTHLRAQGVRCANRNGNCKYRAPNGLKCAVGALIPDAEYKRTYEGKGVKEIHSWIPSLSGVDLAMLDTMQGVHDICNPTEWDGEFKDVASRYALKLPKGRVNVPVAV